MQIILLSGGSGRRLWPLSNDIRSKQFLKLFQDGHGGYESMVQRVYRQIKQAMPDAEITIATGKVQKSATLNHLGNKVSICTEPGRRDTFPAIMLAAAYLRDVKGVSPDEPVVVCPVDPYVKNSYYETIAQMEPLICERGANLTLLGITPTYPSEKFGYIIPERVARVSPVLYFREKPDRETAREYLREGALWNGGVFGFRLSYLLDKARELADFTTYEDLLARYNSLKKISFDYAVVEHESRIQVLTYTGSEWRDVGSWSMLSEVMPQGIIGHALMDEYCWNTQIINELQMPILCMGINNSIIVASSDGILVADKSRSNNMKPYVEKIVTEAKFCEKSWGTFEVIDEQAGCRTAKLSLMKGASMNYHRHAMRVETWTILKGHGRIVIDGVEREVDPGDVIRIGVGQAHKLMAVTEMQCIEVQVGDNLAYEDKEIL